MSLSQIIDTAVGQALALLPSAMDTQAHCMLLAIGLQESRFVHRRQIGGGVRLLAVLPLTDVTPKWGSGMSKADGVRACAAQGKDITSARRYNPRPIRSVTGARVLFQGTAIHSAHLELCVYDMKILWPDRDGFLACGLCRVHPGRRGDRRPASRRWRWWRVLSAGAGKRKLLIGNGGLPLNRALQARGAFSLSGSGQAWAVAKPVQLKSASSSVSCGLGIIASGWNQHEDGRHPLAVLNCGEWRHGWRSMSSLVSTVFRPRTGGRK